jgi:hypothetical protein
MHNEVREWQNEVYPVVEQEGASDIHIFIKEPRSYEFSNHIILVGGLEHFLFSIIYGIILPID